MAGTGFGAGPGGSIPVEKLKGIDNYNTWKFLMKMYMMHEDMYDCITAKDACKDEKKQQKALARICLSVSAEVLPHVRNASTAFEAWTNLERAYEDRGLSTRLGLLRTLFSLKLKDTEGMEKYITKITELTQRLREIDSPLDDEFIAIIMLSGLTNDYDPLIMALENSNMKLSSEMVKSKLLQETQRREERSGEAERSVEASALIAKKAIRCFKCKKLGHYKKNCPTNTKIKHNPNQEKKPKDALLSALAVNVHQDKWYLDSGATNHMCNRKDIMREYVSVKPLEVYVANGQKLSTVGRGNVLVRLRNCEKTISNVYYVPNLTTNLLSVSELTRKGYRVVFNNKQCKILGTNSKVVATASFTNGVYQLDTVGGSEIAMNSSVEPGVCGESQEACSGQAAKVTQDLWHKRLGHLNHRSMYLMKNGMVTGMHFENTNYQNCIACIEGKQCKLPFPKKSMSRSKVMLGLVHTDVCGPLQAPSISGYRYFVTFIDDFSRKTWIYFLKSKNEVFNKFKIFKALVENESGRKIQSIRSDNGTEYVNNEFQKYLEASGIRHQTTVPRCSAQNGVAERANRTIMEKARCMLRDAGLENKYWAEAVNTAVYLKNRSPTKAVLGVVPEEKWTSKKVDVKHIRVFGCIAYALVENRQKLDSKSKKYIFVGYCEDTKGYRLLDPSCPKKLIKARHVTFLENMFLKGSMSHDDIKDTSVSVYECPISSESRLAGSTPASQESPDRDHLSDDINPRTRRRRQMIYSPNETVSEETGVDETEDSSDLTYIPGSSEDSDSAFQDVYEYAQLAGMLQDETGIPESVHEALSSSENKHWRAAMEDEYNSFNTNQSWTLVDLPKGKKPVKCKWVFTKKRGPNGELLKYKARLVAKGYSQKFGIDYNETFSPVVRYSTMRILLALAAQYDLDIEHLDVKTAFLNGDLKETVYMEQPEGFVNKGNTNKVYRLNKAIYGLKQAAKSWYEKINSVFINKLKFRKLSSEPCVFLYSQGEEYIIIALYVDDILLFSSKSLQKKKDEIKKNLKEEFEMKDMGQASHVLGMKITRNGNKITLDQSSYIKRILDRFNMSECNPAVTPMETGLKLQKAEKKDCRFDYRNLIGCLMYLSVCSRPDISYAVSYLSQFNECFSEEHWKAAKRVMRYLKGTIEKTLVFEKGDMKITAYADADWAASHLDRRSYTGYVFYIGNSLVSWESRKQKTVALSSAEAEYMAISDTCKEALFLRTFIYECLNITCDVTLCNDSQSAQKMCVNPIRHARTKHIDIRHHFVRDLINDKIINLRYVPTDKIIADVLTKPLTREKHKMFVSLLFQ